MHNFYYFIIVHSFSLFGLYYPLPPPIIFSSYFHMIQISISRHKMLTNGSFVSLKDIPSGSEEGSTRMTSSTLDDSNG